MGGRHRTDELEGGFNPEHEQPSRRRGGGPGKVFVPLAGAVALAVLCGVAAYVVVNKNPECGEAGSSGDKIGLTVVASPDIQPAVQKIASRFAKSGKKVNGKCVAVTVKAAESADVANAIAGTGPTKAGAAGKAGAVPDLWIPDSKLWTTGLPENGTAKMAGNAARSPIVLTTSKSGAEKLSSGFSPASWTGLMSAANAANPDGLARKVRVLALDPTQNAAGLGALLAGASVLKAKGGSEELLVGVLRQLSGSTVPSPDNLFATLTKTTARVPVGVASEQAVWSFNTKTSPSNPAVALYPTEGTVSLDYPIVIRAENGAVRKAADAFAAELTSASGKKTVQDYGFRTPEGTGGGLLKPENGVNAKKPAEIALPDQASIDKLAQAWRQIKLGTRLLGLIDISGTMAEPADSTGVSRMKAITDTSIEGLKLFPGKAEVGIWAFSDNLQGQGVDWKPIISIGPLAQQVNGVTRRDRIIRAMQRTSAIPTGNTGLNDTLWAAYQKMTKEYQPDKVNTILLFTDGVGNDDPTGGLENDEIIRKLKQTYDPKRPVSILIISFNTTKDDDRAQMTAIAKATGGAAYFPQTVLEIRDIFLKGIARRLCAPNCEGARQ
ncbi:substrate-binding and VWA domain-containing protein [Sphaerimonospora mesophila]|uniref:substrate-binding and VWA domain-containing protein n=1 Tax=Sphaerimonospora mesophila TaxID=37483 RepID=UPI0006E34E50